MFFDLQYGKMREANMSKVNYDEANFVFSLLKEIASASPTLFKRAGKIGIISPYKAQVLVIRDLLKRMSFQLGMSPKSWELVIEVNTVDAF